jgi:hypothetical protein
MRVTKQLGSASGHPIQFFGCRDERPSSGGVTHCRLGVVEEIRHPRDGREVASFCRVKRGGSDLDRAPFEGCVLETNGKSGKFLKILKQKMY